MDKPIIISEFVVNDYVICIVQLDKNTTDFVGKAKQYIS